MYVLVLWAKIFTGRSFNTVLLSRLETMVAMAIIILILYIIVKMVIPMLRFGTREYIVENLPKRLK